MKQAVFAALLSIAASVHAANDAPPVADSPVLDDRYPERRIDFPQGVVGFADLTYAAPQGFRPLTLDFYRPGGKVQPRPLVVYIHGGGWQSGHTRHSGAFENWPNVLAAIAARGYAVASIEYRLSAEARFPAAIQDVKASIQWLRAHGAELGVDPKRAVVWGGSAGGQLAALAAMSCGAANLAPSPPVAKTESSPSDCVQGVIAWYGIFDFAQMPFAADSAPAKYFGCVASGCSPAAKAAASAATYVDAKDPPVLLIHGVDDRVVPVAQSRAFYKTLQSKGVKSELVEILAVDHSFIGSTPRSTREASLQALNKSIEFIERTLGKAQ